MARLESEPCIKSLRIDAGSVRQQFDQSATLGTCFRNRPLHQLFADAAAAALAGDADIFDQCARGALRTQARQDAELQAADHRTPPPPSSSATTSWMLGSRSSVSNAL